MVRLDQWDFGAQLVCQDLLDFLVQAVIPDFLDLSDFQVL